ncbi:MAG TPA: PQQ-dependent dehydrogenase, methanol/ethanol family [Steroidobacteraceae bacterium]|nr:PQQ-dependent dehydrogenase, methanol/ethanol family [Steroidobacteraceae bacterium]
MRSANVLAIALILTSAFARAGDFETPPAESAAASLSAQLVSGPDFHVLEPVESDGLMHHYLLESRFGDFSAYGQEALKVRVREVAALTEISKQSDTGVIAKTVEQHVRSDAKTVTQVVTNPIGVVGGIPRGISHLFSGAKAQAGEFQESVEHSEGSHGNSSIVTSAKADARKYADRYLGISAAERRYYQKLGIDPYTSNAPLRKAVHHLSRVEAATSLGLHFAGIPGVPYLGDVRRALDAIYTENPAVLRARERKALVQYGLTPGEIARYQNTPLLSPTRQSLLAEDAKLLDGVAGRDELFRHAMSVTSEDEMQVFLQSTRLLVHLHEREPLARILPGLALPAAETRDGRLVVAGAFDAVYWTADVAGYEHALHAALPASSHGLDLWLSGSVSPLARGELGRRGWHVQDHAWDAPPAGSVRAADVTLERLTALEPDQWAAPGRDANGTYYSPLKDIHTGNVAELGFAWDYDLGTNRGQESTPLVIDGVMYATSNFGRVYALDAASGKEIWTYDPHIDGQWARYACCDAVNRGLVAFEGRLYVGALDGWLHALDARTGQLLWKVDALIGREQHKPYTLTGTPLLAGDLIIVGNAGADFAGARGYVTAYDVRSGEQRWRFFTVPRDPALGPQDQPHLEAAVRTWDPKHRWDSGSGGTVWDGMAYDPTLNLVYIGTANAAPYNIHLGGQRGGDELYAASIVAIHAGDGSMAWYYQTTPGDRWDYDSTQKLILADVELGGRLRHVVMQAAKNGFYYVLDRASGELLSAQNFAYVSWTRGIDPKTGRPILDPGASYDRGPALVFPSEAGAHSWQPMAFDPQRAVTFIPVFEAGNVLLETSGRRAGLVEGQFTTPAFPTEMWDPASMQSLYGKLPTIARLARRLKTDPASRGFLRAWSVPEHRVLWEAQTATSWDGGVLATAGGLVFQGDANGNLNAYAADSGKPLASIAMGSSMMAAPMTYRVNGTQYVAIVAGYGGGGVILGAPLDPASAAYRYGNEGRIIALKIGGPPPPLPPLRTDPPLPEPPARPTDRAQIAAGEVLYNRFCSRCHVMGRGNLPDLRRLDAVTHGLFSSIVLGGAYTVKGMGRFDDVLSAADAEAIHAYLIDGQWRLKEAGAGR